MQENAAEFLRRVSIICLEDAVLHPDMPLLVWLMCAHAKGYTLGSTAASACLQIVHELACVPVRDCYPSYAAASDAATPNTGVHAVLHPETPPPPAPPSSPPVSPWLARLGPPPAHWVMQLPEVPY